MLESELEAMYGGWGRARALPQPLRVLFLVNWQSLSLSEPLWRCGGHTPILLRKKAACFTLGRVGRGMSVRTTAR